MKPKIEIFCIEGSGSSSRTESNTISSIACDCALANENRNVVRIRQYSSALWPIRRRRRFLRDIRNSEADCVLLIGKSLGAVRLYQELNRSGELFARFQGIRIVTVDPHSPFPSFHSDKKPVDGRPFSMTCKGINLRQVEHWPTGAEIIGANNIQLCDCDHFSIIHDKAVARAISSAIYSLTFLV